ncbi:MAG: VCBS repeat-containing protein, partial [Planctomycetota bacterium]
MGIEWFGAGFLGWCLLIGAADDSPQFVEVEGAVPGPVHWTEAVVPVDVNGDGRLDLLCVNCDGWARPGDMGAKSDQPLAPTLLINESEPGALRFIDGTAQYLPADFMVFGKDAIAADIDGDGHADLVFACAFGNQQRLLRWDPAGG